MTAVVPEPGAMALGAAVLGALATLSRRRRTLRR
jgi:MYXO-CTERM domain-containing protein